MRQRIVEGDDFSVLAPIEVRLLRRLRELLPHRAKAASDDEAAPPAETEHQGE